LIEDHWRKLVFLSTQQFRPGYLSDCHASVQKYQPHIHQLIYGLKYRTKDTCKVASWLDVANLRFTSGEYYFTLPPDLYLQNG
jgi:hypothetical protein